MRQHNRAEPCTAFHAPDQADQLSRAAQAFVLARQLHHRGVAVSVCVGPLLDLAHSVVDKAAEMMLAELLSALFARGWTPLDLGEVGRRRLPEDALSYLLDAAAAVTDSYPDALVDARWRAQLSQYDARVWWDERTPQLTCWAARSGSAAGVDRGAVLGMVVSVLAAVDRLPRLEAVLPRPGTAAVVGTANPGTPSHIDATQEKVLGKVRALLAKAESSDFHEEAEALSAKAQQLMSRYALDQALLEQAHGVRQQATMCRIWLESPYLSPKAMLINAVASANRCRSVLTGELGFVTVVGADLDLRVVELLSTSLLLQGTRAMLMTGSQVSYSGVSRTRSYRQSFLVAYAGRIGERLRAANHASASVDQANRLLPVLSARSRAVDELIKRQFPRLVAKDVSVSNAAGWGAGRAAADQARFDVHSELGAAG